MNFQKVLIAAMNMVFFRESELGAIMDFRENGGRSKR